MWNILEPDESLPSIDIERGETIDLLLSLPLLGEEARKLALLSDQIDPAIVAALDRSIAADDTETHPGRVHFPIVALTGSNAFLPFARTQTLREHGVIWPLWVQPVLLGWAKH